MSSEQDNRPESKGASPRPRQAELLRRHGIRLDKSLGQHFLSDRHVPDRIADCVGKMQPTRVVELGCGAGALSFALLEQSWPVHALELDPRMIALMEAETADLDFRVTRCDLAKTDFTEFVNSESDERLVFAGNLPYQVTSPILFGLLPALQMPTVVGAVVMIQAEVAKRIVASPGGRDYGILSVLLQAELVVERAFAVKPGSFVPPPAVDSAVITLRRRDDAVDLGEAGRALVKDLFSQRRKQMGGLLRKLRGLSESDVERMGSELNLEPSLRPESLSVNDFARLSAWLSREQS